MTGPIETPEAVPTGPERRRSIGFITVVLAFLFGIPAALLIVASSCACTTTTDLVVLNYTPQDATVTWDGPGLLGLPALGPSGSSVAPACATLARSFRPGRVSVTLRAAGETRVVDIAVPGGAARDGHAATLVIEANGHVTGPTDGPPTGGYPEDPLCE